MRAPAPAQGWGQHTNPAAVSLPHASASLPAPRVATAVHSCPRRTAGPSPENRDTEITQLGPAFQRKVYQSGSWRHEQAGACPARAGTRQERRCGREAPRRSPVTGTNHYYHCHRMGSPWLPVSVSSLAAMIHTNKTHRGGAHTTQ